MDLGSLKSKFIETIGFSQQWVVTICGSAIAKGHNTKKGVLTETLFESNSSRSRNDSTTEGESGQQALCRSAIPFGSQI
jgi:hypothetical protein